MHALISKNLIINVALKIIFTFYYFFYYLIKNINFINFHIFDAAFILRILTINAAYIAIKKYSFFVFHAALKLK